MNLPKTYFFGIILNMTHQMRLQCRSFENIKSGKKTDELRLNDEKRRLIRETDRIEFTNISNSKEKLTTEVTYLKTYPTFKELFVGVRDSYINWNEEEFLQSMYEYYTTEDEVKYGALEIGIKVLTDYNSG
jgi:ASC-1-like (ASCH) protein